MNIELLNKIVAHAEEEPRRFNMHTWYEDVSGVLTGQDTARDANGVAGTELFEDESDVPPCGAVGCLAGTACILSGKASVENEEVINGRNVITYFRPSNGWFEAGRDALDLTREQAESLFFSDAYLADSNAWSSGKHYWPEPFATEYTKNRFNPEARVQILKRRVAHFIATEGRE